MMNRCFKPILKKKHYFTLVFLFVVMNLFSQILITSSIASTKSDAAQGSIYKTSDTDEFYIGLEDGSLQLIGDVSVKGSADGQSIIWNTANNKWEPTVNSIDTSEDAWVNTITNTSVSLLTQSDGSTARTLGTEFVVLDNGNIGIGTSTPNAIAALEIKSTEKGVLLPRMTSLQRIAINSALNGLLVYDTDTDSFWSFKNSLWVEIISGAPSIITNTIDYTLSASDNGKIIEFDNTSDIICTVPSGLPVGFQVSVTQLGAGQVNFVGSGVVINNPYNATKTSTQFSKAGIEVTSSNLIILSGDVSK